MEEKFATQTFVTVQPDGLDPCDVRLAHGDGAVRDLIARRVPLFEFAIRGVLASHNLDTTEGQLAALDEAAQIVAKIKNKGLRTRYAVNLDRWLGMMNEEFVMARVREHAGESRGRSDARGSSSSGRGTGGAGGRRAGGGERGANWSGSPQDAGFESAQGDGDGNQAAFSPYNQHDPVVRVEREALKLAVQRPALCGPEFDALGAEAFSAPVHGAMFTLIAACGGTAGAGSPRDWVARLREQAPNERAQGFVTGLAVEPLQIAGDPDTKYADVVLARVGELAAGREIASVKARLQRMNPVTEQAGYNKMFGDLVGLEKRRKALLDRAAGL
jgi:DNA primase